MVPTFALAARKGSLLSRYTQRMGALFDRRLSQAALEAARSEAEGAARSAMAASRAKTEFLANMSHEVHTPLSSIIGFAEMMEREVLGPIPHTYREYAKNIVESGKQLLGVVSDVLDMSQIEGGKYRLAESEVDVGETLAGIFGLVQGRAAQAGLFLQARMAKDLPKLKADPKAFKQIVINLLSNAIKFTKAGGHIYALPALTPEGELSIRVVDTGIGIKAGDLARIVLPFEQLGGAMTRNRPGAGLGLALVNALIRLHGGTLALQSKVGVGTIATVTFPRWRLMRAPDAALGEAGIAPEPAPDAPLAPPVPARFRPTLDRGN